MERFTIIVLPLLSHFTFEHSLWEMTLTLILRYITEIGDRDFQLQKFF